MEQTFPIQPASNADLWFIVPISLLLVAVLGLLLYSVYSLYHLRAVVDGESLVIRGDLNGRRIPLDQLHLDQAQIVDLGREVAYSPGLRTNGIGLPGYQSGWFKLRNGERALVFVTRAGRVVHIPTTNDYALLIEPASAEAFLEALRAAAAPTPPGRI